MSTLPILLSLGTVTTVSGTLVLDTSRKVIRRYMALRKSPPSNLSTLKEGHITIRGTSLASHPVKSLLTQRPVLASRLIAEQWVDGAGGKGTGCWRTFADLTESRPFLLESNGHQVCIEGHHLDLDMPLSGEVLQGTTLDLPGHLADIFDAHGIYLRLWPSPATIRCREYILEPGEQVTVCGRVSRCRSSEESPYRSHCPPIHLGEGGWGNILVSDRTREMLVRSYHRRLLTGVGLLGTGLSELAFGILMTM